MTSFSKMIYDLQFTIHLFLWLCMYGKCEEREGRNRERVQGENALMCITFFV